MMDVYGTLYRKALFPTWEGVVRRRPTLEIAERLLGSEWCTLDELSIMQGRALRELVRHAYRNVPHYRERFERAGVRPEDVRTRDDLERLPLLTRAEAQDGAERRRSVAGPRVAIEKSTSGSTGEPLSFGYDRASEHWRQAIKLRGWGWTGWRAGDRTLFLWGSLDALYPRHWKKKGKVAVDRFLRRELYIDSNARSEADLARAVATIRSFRPRALVCFSQAGAELARFVNQTNARSWDDTIVICGAERLFPADRLELQRAFGPAVFETYGSREVMLIAGECEAHDGMHVSMENLIVELLVADGDGYRSARPGEVGQVAITDLHNLGMPFIRYLCGDLAVFAEPGRCRCGRALTRLARVEGRTNDTLRDADGRAVDSLFFNVLFSVLGGKVKQFQAVQHGDRSISLRLVPSSGFDDGVRRSIEANCRKFFGALPLALELVDDIPTGANGKRRVVVVEH